MWRLATNSITNKFNSYNYNVHKVQYYFEIDSND